MTNLQELKRREAQQAMRAGIDLFWMDADELEEMERAVQTSGRPDEVPEFLAKIIAATNGESNHD